MRPLEPLTELTFSHGMYISGRNGSHARFRWVKAPTSEDLTQLTHTIAQRIARYLERQDLLVRDAGNSYLTAEGVDVDPDSPMNQLLGSSITYRIAVGHNKAARYSRCRPCQTAGQTAHSRTRAAMVLAGSPPMISGNSKKGPIEKHAEWRSEGVVFRTLPCVRADLASKPRPPLGKEPETVLP